MYFHLILFVRALSIQDSFILLFACRIYSGVMKQVNSHSYIKKTLFNWGFSRKAAYMKAGVSHSKVNFSTISGSQEPNDRKINRVKELDNL